MLARKFSFKTKENHDLLLFSPGCGIYRILNEILSIPIKQLCTSKEPVSFHFFHELHFGNFQDLCSWEMAKTVLRRAMALWVLQPHQPWKGDLPQMLAAVGKPSSRGNGDVLGSSQESKRMLPDSQVEQPAGSINLMDLAASPAPAGQDPGVCKAAGRVTELLGENRYLHKLTRSATHTYRYIYTQIHLYSSWSEICRIYEPAVIVILIYPMIYSQYSHILYCRIYELLAGQCFILS